jgi:16S rRNA (cytosine967-C5)-methyltransferase
MSTPAPGAPARAIAARVVSAVIDGGHSLKAELGRELPGVRDSRDRALVEAMCFEALRWRRPYEHALQAWMSRPLPARERRVHALLLVGLAQLLAMKLPPHAALSATAEAARLVGGGKLVGLVNALLRRATRDALPVSDSPSVRSSHPDWLHARLASDWPEDLEQILVENNIAAPMWLRVNARQGSREAYARALDEAGIACTLPGWPACAIRLDTPMAPAALPGWGGGAVSVQDLSAQLATLALAPAEGALVLDACAAPGGKAAHLLETTAGLRLLALDRDAGRLGRVVDTLKRLGLEEGVVVKAADAVDTSTWWDARAFDAILLDAPCSATGIIRRQPDIKWHRRETDIEALAAQQARLLDALWPTLRPGGRLLYATCSVLREENSRQVEAFLERADDAHALALPEAFGRVDGPGRQRLPGEDGGDGFFYALIGKGA